MTVAQKVAALMRPRVLAAMQPCEEQFILNINKHAKALRQLAAHDADWIDWLWRVYCPSPIRKGKEEE